MKQYFIKDDLFSKSKEQVITYMKKNHISELTVFEAEKIRVEQFFYCKLFGMSERDGMTCGARLCKKYDPRNGKSGCCKNIGSLFDYGKEVIFKI